MPTLDQLWPAADVAYLIDNYEDTPNTILAERLNRTMKGVQQKAKRLKLHKSCEGRSASAREIHQRSDAVPAAHRPKRMPINSVWQLGERA